MKIKLSESELRTIIQKVIKESGVSDKQRNQPFNTRVSFDDKVYIARNKSTIPPLSQGAVDNAVKYSKITEDYTEIRNYKNNSLSQVHISRSDYNKLVDAGKYTKNVLVNGLEDGILSPRNNQDWPVELIIKGLSEKGILDYDTKEGKNYYYLTSDYYEAIINKNQNIVDFIIREIKDTIDDQYDKIVDDKSNDAINEDTRGDMYKTQIEKEFPGALNNYDGKMSYDEYYLQLTNDKKQQDKLNSRELKKQATKDRNEKYKAEFGERDKQIRKQIIENRKLELIDDFVDFLPENLPETIERLMMKYSDQGKDSIFYFLIGKYMGAFTHIYDNENEEKLYGYLNKLINNDKYEEYFFGKIDEKYGEHVIEW